MYTLAHELLYASATTSAEASRRAFVVLVVAITCQQWQQQG
jgi:hypothetical protein